MLSLPHSLHPPRAFFAEAATCRHRAFFFPYVFVIITPELASIPTLCHHPTANLHTPRLTTRTSPPTQPTTAPNTMSAAVEHPLVEPQQSAPLQEASAVEAQPETTPAVTEDKPAEAAAAPVEEAPKADGEAAAAAAPVEEKKEEKPTEPIYSGALGYKAPGLKK